MRLPRPSTSLRTRNDDSLQGEMNLDSQIENAVRHLKEGGVVIFPTDTVWGIGAWVESEVGVRRLYTLKKRDQHKPTAILVGGNEQAGRYGELVGEGLTLVKRYWPGALTVVVRSKLTLPEGVANEQGGVGVRWPNSTVVEEMCRQLGGGIVASSANVAGGKAPTRYEEIESDLLQKVDGVVTWQQALSGVSSTVVDLMGEKPVVLRQGEIKISISY